MEAQQGRSKPKKETEKISEASYFGLTVQVIVRLKQSSLVRYQNQNFIVDTQDLRIGSGLSMCSLAARV